MPSHPRPDDSFKGKDLGDEFLVYDHQHDRVHMLNGTAREIFLLCDGSRTENEVATAFAQKYDVDEETARRDAETTIRELYELGLLSD